MDCPELRLRVGSSGTCWTQGESWQVTVASVDTTGRPLPPGQFPFDLTYRSAGNRPLLTDPDQSEECGSYENPCDGPENYDPDSDIAPECLSTDPPSYCPPEPEQ